MSRVHIVEMLERALSLGGKESVRLLAPEIECLLIEERGAAQPKMCPVCSYRCLAPTMIIGETGCDHCKALEAAICAEQQTMECGHPKACWMPQMIPCPGLIPHDPKEFCEYCESHCLACAEREKVREMCAVETLKRAGELRDLLNTIEESCGPGDMDAETERLRMENRAEELELVAAGIRQLDLTAPSTEEAEEVKAPCGHSAKYLKYDQPTRTIRCQLCVNPRPFVITEAEAQMDEGSGSR